MKIGRKLVSRVLIEAALIAAVLYGGYRAWHAYSTFRWLIVQDGQHLYAVPGWQK